MSKIYSTSEEEEETSTEEETSDEEVTSSEEESGPSGFNNNPNYVGSPAGAAAPVAGQFMMNNPNDEAYAVNDGRNIRTPMAEGRNPAMSLGSGAAVTLGAQGAVTGGEIIRNNPMDERVSISDAENVPTPTHAEHLQRNQAMMPGAEEDTDEDEEEDDEEVYNEPQQAINYAGQRPDALTEAPMMGADTTTEGPVVMSNLEYNPQRYAKVNAKASREIQDLFKHIQDYQPFVAELPAKLRPFIPDYIPAIGDLDPFVKIPRPDGTPDGLGLYVVDEPSIPQSNPAVVQLELRATNVRGGAGAQVVDSFEDAANRPEVIDRWITDIKKVHYKKALPTVNYQKQMPDVESLLQVWPQEFEDFLNSDVQLPPPGIDLDMDQYVRTLCALVDIPTYNSLIDSLHVMFTVYEDFRSNQHFQHE